MPRKNRGYKKGKPYKDSRLFVIACEGKTEVPYFEALVGHSQRLKVILLPPKDDNLSAPKWVRNRAATYIEEFPLKGKDDELWFIMDVDRWKKEVLIEIIKDCQENEKWFIGLSNPCFEVWLYAHLNDLNNLKIETCKEIKKMLKKNYSPTLFAQKHVDQAIKYSIAKETDPNSDFPFKYETKLHLLAQKILSFR